MVASHLNVYKSCLRILREKGYRLEVKGERAADGSFPVEAFWIARRDDFYFCGDNPIELLGLVAMYDHLQPKADVPYWWQVHDTKENLWADLLDTLPLSGSSSDDH